MNFKAVASLQPTSLIQTLPNSDDSMLDPDQKFLRASLNVGDQHGVAGGAGTVGGSGGIEETG